MASRVSPSWAIAPKTEWPYVIAKFKTKPPKNAYADALKYK